MDLQDFCKENEFILTSSCITHRVYTNKLYTLEVQNLTGEVILFSRKDIQDMQFSNVHNLNDLILDC